MHLWHGNYIWRWMGGIHEIEALSFKIMMGLRRYLGVCFDLGEHSTLLQPVWIRIRIQPTSINKLHALNVNDCKHFHFKGHIMFKIQNLWLCTHKKNPRTSWKKASFSFQLYCMANITSNKDLIPQKDYLDSQNSFFFFLFWKKKWSIYNWIPKLWYRPIIVQCLESRSFKDLLVMILMYHYFTVTQLVAEVIVGGKNKKTLKCQFFFSSGTFWACQRNPGPKNIVSVA